MPAAAVCDVTPGYEPRQPAKTPLYRVVQEHLLTFLERAESDPTSGGMPAFVERELRGFLDCGILANGFLRVHCDACGHDSLVGFSCKGRGFCPSCCGRRMSARAAHLVDHVLPDIDYRQWVLTVPYGLRFLLGMNADLCTEVLRVHVRAVFGWYRRRARAAGVEASGRTARSGAITAIQRFDSALRLNVHFHTLVGDGVYHRPERDGPLVWWPAPAPTDEEVAALCRTIGHRTRKLLRRRGYDAPDADDSTDDQPQLAAASASSVQGRSTTGPIERGGVLGVVAGTFSSPRCATIDSFSLHANTTVDVGDRDALEHLCRYLLRPPLATKRLSLTSDDRVRYDLKRPYRDGTTHFIFEPLQFLERLAALIPRPRANLLRYHGVFAPNASWRAEVVPPPPPVVLAADTDLPDDELPEPAHPKRRDRYITWAL